MTQMEMTCERFDEVVHGFVRMELLDVRDREAALEHAAHCEACSQRMADATVLAEASELAARNALGEQTPPSVEAVLRAEFRNHHRRNSWRRTVEWLSIGAAAAILILFVWTMKRPSNGPSNRPPAPTAEKGGAVQAALPSNAGGTAIAAKEQPAPATGAKPAAAPESEAYIASDFVPVPYTAAITADDPGMVVRVQLTRSSLAQLGYPVAETPGEDLILADVLVGEDGWPRGVKLIQ
jgi:hypothetical protein